MAAIALIGFIDASYLAKEHLSGQVPDCSILEGCDVVTTSVYSEIFGIPVALLGALYYLSVFLLLMIYVDTRKKRYASIAALLTPLGFISSVILVYIMANVLQAWCIYCLGSAATSTLLFLFAFPQLKKIYKTKSL